MALVTYLWRSGGKYPPWITEDVVALRLCEMYHCRPSELDEEDWHVVMRHRAIKAAEQDYIARDAKARQSMRTRRRGTK